MNREKEMCPTSHHLRGDQKPCMGMLPALLPCNCPGIWMQSELWDKAQGKRGQETSQRVGGTSPSTEFSPKQDCCEMDSALAAR